MELALQHPEYGYYRRHDPLGAAGDFITAPEISQVFGELIGLWCVDLWLKLGKPNPFALCEMGPGRGTLMRDALRAAQIMPEFIQACRLFLLESNADLRAAQAQALAAYQPFWLDALHALPNLPTLVISNEFFDALPIRQFVRQGDNWGERCVGVVDGVLHWVIEEVPPSLSASFPRKRESRFIDASTNGEKRDSRFRGNDAGSFVFEAAPASQLIMQRLSRHIVAHGGAALAIDYGYAVTPGTPTFQALVQHRFTDPLHDPGNADLTAHVDFGALAMVVQGQGCVAWPLLTQGDFLLRLGIAQRCAKLAAQSTPSQRDAITAAHGRLTDSTEMGSLFKVLCVTPTAAPVPAGWE
jgi:NADH dehydrogenase [ubiquinone] 1 alpha subcomplex assembly factor 7